MTKDFIEVTPDNGNNDGTLNVKSKLLLSTPSTVSRNTICTVSNTGGG